MMMMMNTPTLAAISHELTRQKAAADSAAAKINTRPLDIPIVRRKMEEEQ